jgi:hypothetical protein
MVNKVQFDTDQNASWKSTSNSLGRKSGLIGFLMKHGVKSESTANYILLAIVLISIVLTGIVYYAFLYAPSINTSSNTPSLLREKINKSHI